MMSSKTQSAATRSVETADGCSICWKAGSSSVSKSGRIAEAYTLKRAPTHSTMFCTSTSSLSS